MPVHINMKDRNVAKRLTKGKRKNLVALVARAAVLVERDRNAKLQARSLMRDYLGRTRHQLIW